MTPACHGNVTVSVYGEVIMQLTFKSLVISILMTEECEK